MSATTKISPYNLADLKNTTDDALPNYLSSIKFTQNHSKTDTRLLLGYSAVTIAGALFYFDWKFGWDATKAYTLPAVVAYFILNGILTWWIWWVESGVVFEGEGKNGKVRIDSSTRKHVPEYRCTVTYSTPGSAAKVVKIKAPFSRWFTKDGYFVAKPFQQWLASEVPVVGAADPNNVVEEIGRGSEAERVLNVSGANVLDVLEQLKKTGKPGVNASPAAGSGSGRRRKA